ncbi:MAG TPA: DUF3592 domain-containing protein [Holophagaceae bacterium]|nr:DUF3592 domain-containing protein [Holophagaceae bacterium]
MKGSVVLLFLGLALAGLGWFLLFRAHHRVDGRPVISGEVAALIPVRGSKGGTSYKLRVAYQDPAGTPGTLTTRWAQNPPAARAGESVKLAWVSPGEPPVLLLFSSLFGVGFVLTVIGLALALLGGGFAYGPELVRRLYLS